MTGDTLCDSHYPVMLERPMFPEPVVSVAIEPRLGGDQPRLAVALARLTDEDPTLHAFAHPETGQCIVAGMGELHLEVVRKKIEEHYGVATRAGPPEIAYRETITKQAEADYLLRKQSGGSGMYARVVLRTIPGSPGTGVEVENRVKGGSIPAQYTSAVERGVSDAVQTGVIAGYPLVDLQVQILDGAAHVKDSNDMAFRLAAAEALREAVRRGSPLLLERVMSVDCTVPTEYQGEVLSDLRRRRGTVLGLEGSQGAFVIHAEVPLAEMVGYADAIRSLSRGRANYTMTPARFEVAPSAVFQQVLGAG